MMIVVKEKTKEDDSQSFILQIKGFGEHALLVSTQYKQLQFLKDSHSGDELVFQMDFAENYSCQSFD